ncbi:MAG TPA: hypothetical protein PKM88_10990, partial [bacterium]|nr:hypothetical protein [bacterium]
LVPLLLVIMTLAGGTGAPAELRLNQAWLGWALGAGIFLLLAFAVVRGVNRDRRWGEIMVLLMLLGELVFYHGRLLEIWPAGSYEPQRLWREWAAERDGRWSGRLLAADRAALGMLALDGCRLVNVPFVAPERDPLAGLLMRDTGEVAHPLWAYCSLAGVVAGRTLPEDQPARGDLLLRAGTGLHFAELARVARPPAYLPFAFISGKAHTVTAADLPAALATLDWINGEVVTTDRLAETVAVAGSAADDELRATAQESDRLEWQVTTAAPALLFVAQRWHPDWRAVIDSMPVPVVRANALFCAVALPAGRHTVKLHFRAPARAWAWGLFAAALLATVYLLAGRREWHHPLAHSLPRLVQRGVVLLLLLAAVGGVRWPTVARQFAGALAAPVTEDYAAVTRSFHRHGIGLAAYHAAARVNGR